MDVLYFLHGWVRELDPSKYSWQICDYIKPCTEYCVYAREKRRWINGNSGSFLEMRKLPLYYSVKKISVISSREISVPSSITIYFRYRSILRIRPVIS